MNSRSRPSTFLACLALSLAVFGFVGRACGQSLQPLLVSGPVSNCFNVVFLSEGYTSIQLPQFLTDASNALNTVLSRQPFQEYRPYLNAYAIAVASPQAGSDHPSSGSYVNTYFNSSYDAYDYLVTIPPNSYDPDPADGQAKVDALLQTFVPNCALPVVIVNDLLPGGSDGFDKVAVTSRQVGAWDILVHESGHVIANLGDEYTSAPVGGTASLGEDPNTTQQTNLSLIKWKAWIPAGTPIPTPAAYAYDSVVGLFEGAHYNSTGWYRPMLNCAMNSKECGSFCSVCREALVLSLYRYVRTITGFSPATNLPVSNTQPLTFSLSLLQPASHRLDVQWYCDGTALAGTTGPACTLAPATLGSGYHEVKAVVQDNTGFVRNDPLNRLSQTNTWWLNVSLPWLQLANLGMLNDRRFTFQILGSNAPQGVVTQLSTNLIDWTSIATNAAQAAPFSFFYTNQTPAPPTAFFRALALP